MAGARFLAAGALAAVRRRCPHREALQHWQRRVAPTSCAELLARRSAHRPDGLLALGHLGAATASARSGLTAARALATSASPLSYVGGRCCARLDGAPRRALHVPASAASVWSALERSLSTPSSLLSRMPRGFGRFGGGGGSSGGGNSGNARSRGRESETAAGEAAEGRKEKGASEKQSAPAASRSKDSLGADEESGRDGSGGGGGGGGGGPNPPKFDAAWFQQLGIALLVFFGLNALTGRFGSGGDGAARREINFQQFVRDLLEPGLVDHIEVINKQTARVYLKSGAATGSAAAHRRRQSGDDLRQQQRGRRSSGSPDGQSSGEGHDESEHEFVPLGGASDESWSVSSSGSGTAAATSDDGGRPRDASSPASGHAPYYFTIGSVESFEHKMEQVQSELGIEERVPIVYQSDSRILSELLKLAPTLIILGLGYTMLRSSFGGMPGAAAGGRNIFQVGKANPMVMNKNTKKDGQIMFKDVAGLDEAKREVVEFVDFLKSPSKYQELGAKIPKGALLVGPPGTGKTLLAKAAAGEAEVPFFSISGSDFIEMFVGVGPSRVRDLFAQARQQAPCIVFIDEIDAVGRARGRSGFGGGSDERENTLNALLVEMDGFSSQTGIVVLAGTNRADILDKALMRPGRFDRQINIDKPDIRGRYQIFKVHLKPLRIAATAGDMETVAKRLSALTPGFSGADIANICNEAALIAARNGKEAVAVDDFEAATDRVIGGLEKRGKVISPEEREVVAYHEAGHAVAAWFLENVDPLLKVSIVPRGSAALGFAQYLPRERYLQSKEELRDFMVMALGGRAAENLSFGRVTTGAQDDLERVTRAAYASVTKFGMSPRIGTVAFPREGEGEAQFDRPYSEETAQIVDEEARLIVDEAYRRCESLLSERLDMVRELGKRLLEREVVREADLVDVLGPRPFSKPTDYDSYVEAYERDRAERTGRGGDDKSAAPGDAADDSSGPGRGDSSGGGKRSSPDAARRKRRGSPPPGGLVPELA